jgi:hypothetical protein
MKNLRNAALGSALALLGVAQAGMVVDDFDDPSGGQTATITHPPDALTVTLGPTTGSLLGTRNITYTVTPLPSDPTVDSLKVNVAPYGSYLVEAADNEGIPDTTLDYSGFDVALTGNTLTLHSFSTDSNNEKVQAWFVTSGGTLTSGWVPVAGNHSGDLTLTLASGSGNLSDVQEIKVEILGDAGADFALHSINVPEPATYGALTALGLLGTVIWRRVRA